MGQWRASADLPATGQGPAAARHAVATLLHGWQLDALTHDAELVVNELVTNALPARARPRQRRTRTGRTRGPAADHGHRPVEAPTGGRRTGSGRAARARHTHRARPRRPMGRRRPRGRQTRLGRARAVPAPPPAPHPRLAAPRAAQRGAILTMPRTGRQRTPTKAAPGGTPAEVICAEPLAVPASTAHSATGSERSRPAPERAEQRPRRAPTAMDSCAVIGHTRRVRPPTLAGWRTRPPALAGIR